VVAAAIVAVPVGVVAAGVPARGTPLPGVHEVLNRVPHQIDPSTLPDITVDASVTDWNHEISGDGAEQIVLTLVENLELETQALLRNDETILTAVDHGDRLDDMRNRLSVAARSGRTVVRRYRIESVRMVLEVPFGRQDGLSVGLQSRGSVTVQTYDAAGNLQSSSTEPLATMFVMRRATGDRWLNVAEVPPEG